MFFRPCKEFSPSRLLLSHLGLLSIEGLMVKQYCYSVCAYFKGFCQTYLLVFVSTIIIFYKLKFILQYKPTKNEKTQDEVIELQKANLN